MYFKDVFVEIFWSTTAETGAISKNQGRTHYCLSSRKWIWRLYKSRSRSSALAQKAHGSVELRISIFHDSWIIAKLNSKPWIESFLDELLFLSDGGHVIREYVTFMNAAEKWDEAYEMLIKYKASSKNIYKKYYGNIHCDPTGPVKGLHEMKLHWRHTIYEW